jgi:hypothetical protein
MILGVVVVTFLSLRFVVRFDLCEEVYRILLFGSSWLVVANVDTMPVFWCVVVRACEES